MMTICAPARAVPVVLNAGVVANAMSGHILRGNADQPIDGCSIDTRTLAPGDLFLAIVGARLDGHAFVRPALAAGAAGVVVSEASAAEGATLVIRVTDTTRALPAPPSSA